MLSVKSNSNRRGALGRIFEASVVALVLLGCASLAMAQGTSVTTTGGYLVFPKIVVHTTGPANPPLAAGEFATDTVIQLTNTSSAAIVVNCYYVNANGHCGGPGTGAQVCQSNSDCPIGLECVPGWDVRDFQVELTPNQPLGWTASTGYVDGLPCETVSCGTQNSFQTSSAVLGVQENPFIGELKCYQIDPATRNGTELPIDSNDLKGEATIVQTNAPTGGSPAAVLASAYNAVSFVAQSAASTPGPLCLGGDTLPPGGTGSCSASYTPCPATLIMEHLFEGATTPEGVVSTELTLVPCSEDLGTSAVPPLSVTAQMLVYNEFEQRFSTNERVQCFENTRLADIDTRPGPEGDTASIFSIGVQGTLGGNTRIRGVQGSANGFGYGLLGLAQSFYSETLGGSPVAAAAYHLGATGDPAITDVVYRP